jgi:multiple sugar transport system ATP-binding protein
MAKVVFKNVAKKYGDTIAVDSFNLEIVDKELFVLVGPSGCGKTTILRLISGLAKLTEGEIYIDNLRMNEVPPRDRDIAMVFQNYALYPHMNVYDNMAFGLKVRKYPKAEIDSRVHYAAGMLNITHLLNRHPKKLSGGEKQRVAVGRAIVRKPKVFLFDEPLSNIDVRLRSEMRAELKKLHKKLRATTIYVTHDHIEAMTLGERICVIKEGIIQQVGTPVDLYNSPVNRFVAGFFGSPPMNFFNVKIIKNGKNIQFDEGTFKLNLPSNIRNLILPFNGSSLAVGVRPEHVRLCPPEKSTAKLKVELVEPMGPEAYINLTTGKNNIIARVSADNGIKAGQFTDIMFDTGKIHIFHPETSNRLRQVDGKPLENI